MSGLYAGGLAGAAAGILGDLAGQTFANIRNGRSLLCINLGEVAGAGLGGLIGGAAGKKMVADGIAALEAAWFGASVGTVGSAVGNRLGGQ